MPPTAAAEEIWVYNPDDEVDADSAFGGCRFTLAPNAATKLTKPCDWDINRNGPWNQRAAADHIVKQLGEWGVCLLSGPVVKGKASNKLDQVRIDAAERVYLQRTLDWATEHVRAYDARNAPYKASGLGDVQPTPDEEKAIGWYNKNKKKLKGLKPS